MGVARGPGAAAGHPAHALSVWTSGKSAEVKADDCAKVHSDGTVADTPEDNLFGRLGSDLTFINKSKNLTELSKSRPTSLPR